MNDIQMYMIALCLVFPVGWLLTKRLYVEGCNNNTREKHDEVNDQSD